MKCVLLLLVLISLGGCEILQDIDRGLYAATNAMTQKDRITGKRVVSNTRTQQIQQGNAVIDNVLAQLTSKDIKYNAALDAAAYSRLDNIFKRIHGVSHLKNETWELILIPDDSFNAFVTGGTYIVIHSGLERQLTDDSEVAAVIGHEFAHVVANHIGERQYHDMFSTLTGSKSVSRSSFQAAFTHENEEEADDIGILYAALAGYDPYAAYRVWHKMYLERGDNTNSFVDHPINSERASQTKATAEKVVRYYTPNQVNSDHRTILQSNSLYTYGGDLAVQAGKGGGLASVLSAGFESYQTHQQAKAEEARQESRIAGLNSINDLLRVTAINQISNSEWRITIKYNGNRNIGELVFKGALFQNRNRLTNFIAKPEGYFSPGGSYYIFGLADHPTPLRTEVTSYEIRATEAKIY